MEDNGSTIDVIGALGTISTLTPYTTFTVETGAQYPDVAAFTGVNTTAGDSAVFVYDGGYELWNVTSTPTGAYAGSTSMTKSRVEAMNFQGTFGVNNARWTAVGHEFNSPYYEVKVVNNLQSGYLSTSLLSGYLGHDQAYPVVAAGNGYPGLQYIGNHQYTTAWYDFGTSYDVYSQDVAFTTGLPVSSSDYYKVSNSSFTDPYINAAGTGSKNSSIAISNSTNDGYGLLTAYFDGEYMVYKYSSTGTNTYNFKPTRIQKVVSKTFGIYPNPASDRINITGSEGNDYNILDMMGRTQLSGTLFDNGDIDISSLASGLHLVELEDKGEKKTTRFVKQ